jgi:protein gp37
MSDRTSIEWTNASWNPIRARGDGQLGWHCEKVSPGCTHCYAERLNGRLGTGLTYSAPNRPMVKLFLDAKILAAPLRWRKPRKIFVCSMTDLFGEWVPDEWIDRIFAVMALAPQHTFQVLTKRARRMREWFARRGPVYGDASDFVMFAREDFMPAPGTVRIMQWPLANVWLGISAEDQQRLNERVPHLLATPAAVRFVSAEPLLGPLDFSFHFGLASNHDDLRGLLNWLIVGGESGPGARPMDIAWARDIVRQCREAGVACFVKQLGKFPVCAAPTGRGHEVIENQRRIDLEWPIGTHFGNPTGDAALNGLVAIVRDKGGDPAEWPEDLRVREWPRP